ncbi:unnamed protein product [Meloidogyne enterolobii]|uniref:Uncharacterized protein n=3 Tax=Meloidogyne enterolobii TaxID=390850 RepID=A0ACB0Y2G9_MELEN|nr:unnamed protein product [Meloidogyne enterolobii]
MAAQRVEIATLRTMTAQERADTSVEAADRARDDGDTARIYAAQFDPCFKQPGVELLRARAAMQRSGTPGQSAAIPMLTPVSVPVQLCTITFYSETPESTIVVKGQRDQAEKDLKKLRESEDVQAEIDLISGEASKAYTGAPSSKKDIYGTKLPWPLVLVLFMMISQQLSGINVVNCYVFLREPVSRTMAYATIAMVAINVLMTAVSVYLVEHLRFGRGTLNIN